MSVRSISRTFPHHRRKLLFDSVRPEPARGGDIFARAEGKSFSRSLAVKRGGRSVDSALIGRPLCVGSYQNCQNRQHSSPVGRGARHLPHASPGSPSRNPPLASYPANSSVRRVRRSSVQSRRVNQSYAAHLFEQARFSTALLLLTGVLQYQYRGNRHITGRRCGHVTSYPARPQSMAGQHHHPSTRDGMQNRIHPPTHGQGARPLGVSPHWDKLVRRQPCDLSAQSAVGGVLRAGHARHQNVVQADTHAR